MKMHTSIYWITLLFILFVLPVQASDLNKEKRWANQIIDYLFDGESYWLEANGSPFLAVYTPAATKNPRGVAILMHGRGVHPDWAKVIKPLRTELPEKGWATLSIQMPVLANDAPYQEYIPLFREVPERIKAAIAFVRHRNLKPIVLIGHSLGATMGSYYLAHHPNTKINAFVGIGMMASKEVVQNTVLDDTVSLRNISIPVLDLYGSRTEESILKTAPQRKISISKAGNPLSEQIVIKGATHFFDGQEDALLMTVTDWLSKATLSHARASN